MKPIEGEVGLYRMDDGSVANIRDFRRFESSDRFEGLNVEIRILVGQTLVVDGWRLTSDGLPTPLEQQQQVVFQKESGRIIAEKTVQSLLSIPGIRERDKSEEKLARTTTFREQRLRIFLRERPIVGCELRVHLYGLRKDSIL